MTTVDPLAEAIRLVREAGYEVGPRRLRISAREVRVGDILITDNGKYRVGELIPFVKITTGSGRPSYWIRALTDIVTVERPA